MCLSDQEALLTINDDEFSVKHLRRISDSAAILVQTALLVCVAWSDQADGRAERRNLERGDAVHMVGIARRQFRQILQGAQGSEDLAIRSQQRYLFFSLVARRYIAFQ